MTRRYKKNDWWDLMTVIEQELERDSSYKTFFNIADELKWRLVESISEGANHKIRVKGKELKDRYNNCCTNLKSLTEVQKEELNAIFDFILTAKTPRK